MIWIASADGSVVLANRRARDITGIATHEADPQGLMAYIHPDDRSETAAALAAALSPPRAWDVRHRVRHADDAHRAMHAAVEPLGQSFDGVLWLGTWTEPADPAAADPPLTPRELEVLQLASSGLNGPALARELHISLSTTKTHFENIYGKLGVRDRAAAVAVALRAGIID